MQMEAGLCTVFMACCSQLLASLLLGLLLPPAVSETEDRPLRNVGHSTNLVYTYKTAKKRKGVSLSYSIGL